MFAKALANVSKRSFSSIFKYTNASNPRVFLSVAQGGSPVGEMVFELYEDRQPATVENFRTLCEGAYEGSAISSGMAGLGFNAGHLSEENLSAFEVRSPDEDMTVRHTHRGQLTMVNDGTNANGSEFMVTYGETQFLNGYNTCFGELVEGEDVLAQLEAKTDRHGNVAGDWTIAASGHKA